jgi:SfnB family sulfur acquisition oxidoreductase
MASPARTASAGDTHVISSDAEAIGVATRLASRLADTATERDQGRRLPDTELAELASSGLLSITVPQSHGGPGVTCLTLCTVIRLLSSGDGSVGQIPQNHFFCLDAVRENGSADQADFFYRLVLDGARFGNALVNTRQPGGSAGATTIEPAPGGGYLVSGAKSYSTGALSADWVPVAATDRDERMHMAFIPRDAPGLVVVDDWDGFGQRTTASGSVILRQAHAEARWVIPTWKAIEYPNTFRAFTQLIHAAIDIGIAEGALAAGADYLRGYASGQPAGGAEPAREDPVVIHHFGELTVLVRSARALLEQAAGIVDEARAALAEPGLPADAAARWEAEANVAMSSARAHADRVTVQAASEWFELAGASAARTPLGLDRYWRDVRTHTLHDPRRKRVFEVGNYTLNDVLPQRGWGRARAAR